MTALSVVVATAQPWPEVRATLESLLEQVKAVGGEIIVAVAPGAEPPAEVAGTYSGVRWVRHSTSSVFALRGLGLRRAAGEIIATTEDHCTAAPDWCASILRVRARHPDVHVFGGAVEAGCRERLLDWAHHFLVFGPAVPPLDQAQRPIVPGGANTIYDRRILPADIPDEGFVEPVFLAGLLARGERVVTDPSIVVTHSQSFPFATCCSLHFHNGRSIAAARLGTLSPLRRAARVASCAILPLYLTALRVRHIWPKRPLRGTLLLGLPWLFALCLAHAWGELLGYLAGPGSSPKRLR
jgi:hypothetical protein